MLIYVPLNRSCGTFSCALYIYVLLPTSPGTFSCTFSTYVLLPTSPGIFQCTFSTYVPPATFTETFWLTFSLYVPKTQRNAQEKGMFPHRNIPSFIMYLFFQFCQFIAVHIRRMTALIMACLLYTSDAADE